MALHPNKDIVATGQMAGKKLNEKTVVKQKIDHGGPARTRGKTGKSSTQGKLCEIHIWSAQTRELVTTLIGFQRRAVRQLEFSPSGNKLLSIGEDDHHSVAIYDWANGIKLCDAKVSPKQIYDVAWSNENEFTVVGIQLFTHFTQSGQTLKGQKSRMNGLQNKEQILSVNFVLNNVCMTGSSNGNLYPWNGGSMGKAIKAHSGCVWVVEPDRNSSQFWTGGDDGVVCLWNPQYQQVKKIDIKKFVTW
jgi:WD40 repeat protein